MLALGFTIVIISMIFEIMVVRELRPEKWRWKVASYRGWRHWMAVVTRPIYSIGPWLEHSTLNSLIFSLCVSIGIGVLFPAAGVAVLIGGIGSTLATQPYYAGRRKLDSVKHWFESRKAA